MDFSKYAVAESDVVHIKAAARRALIAAEPAYFAKTPEHQERFRLLKSEDAQNAIECILLKELCNIKCDANTARDEWNNLNKQSRHKLNWAYLLTSGFGKNCIALNEFVGERKSLLDWQTVYDYDHEDYLFQEASRKKASSEYKGYAYSPLKEPLWARLLVNDLFYYSDITSLATFIMDEVEKTARASIKRLIPHNYVDSETLFKKEDKGYSLNTDIEADGKEKQLKELERRCYAYQQARWLELSESFKHVPATVLILDFTVDDDPHIDFVFNNTSAVKQVRWKHFVADCQKLPGCQSELDKRVLDETLLINDWLEKQCLDIEQHFDPNVIKYEKKYKVVWSQQAIDDLQRLSQSQNDPEDE